MSNFMSVFWITQISHIISIVYFQLLLHLEDIEEIKNFSIKCQGTLTFVFFSDIINVCYERTVENFMKQENDDALAHETVTLLRICGHFLYHRMGDRAGQQRILFILSRHGEILQKKLQEMLEIQSGSLSEMIIKMETDGLIQKVRSQKDGRHIVLKLTEEGMEKSKQFEIEYNQKIKQMLDCLSKKETQELHDLLETLTTHWKKIEKEWDKTNEQT